MSHQDIINERRLVEIKSGLTCNICYNGFYGCKIYQCPNDHPLCSVCEEQLKQPKECPTCRVRFDHPPRRARQIESLAEAFYKDEREVKKTVSARSCGSEFIKCRLCCDKGCDKGCYEDGNCTQPKFRIDDYTKHILKQHLGVRMPRSAETPQKFRIAREHFRYEYFIYGTVLFQLVVKWFDDGNGGDVEHTVFCSVKPKESEKYMWKITYTKGNAIVGFCGTLFEKDWECDFYNLRCMCILPAFDAEKLKDSDGKLKGTFTISREV